MRVVVQRVKKAKCTVDGKVVSEIENGLMLLVGFTDGDNLDIINKMAQKIANLRIFDDNNGVTEAINNFCAGKHIYYMDLGEVGTANIQRIYNEFDSSLRYVDWYTMKYHMLDGDEYQES